jgi:hypothetical protein
MASKRLQILESHLAPIIEVPENFLESIQTAGNYPNGLLQNQVAIITGSGNI